MTTTTNLLNSESTLFATSIGDWTGVDSTVTRATDVIDPNTANPTLKLFKTTGGIGHALIQTASLPAYEGTPVPWPLRATSRVKASANSTVVVYLTTVEGSASTTVSASAGVIADEWTLVSVETEPISTSVSLIEYGIYVTGTSSTVPAYIGHPVIISPWAVIYNFMARETWIRLPEYMREADVNQTELDRPLLRFIDVLTFLAGEIYNTWEGFRWIPPEDNDGTIGLSTLVSPSTVPPGRSDILRWLIQIVGAQFFDPSTGLTPWENLDVDNNPLTDDLTWSAFPNNAAGSPFDIAPADNYVSWTEIQSYDVAVTNLDPFLRWQITSAAFGFRAGTKESVVNAAKQALGGTQSVVFTPRYGGDPWHIALTILSAEGDVGEVEQTVAPAMPAGFQLTVLET